MKPTRDTYTQLDRAYSHFNKTLFGNSLPACVITLQRKKGAYGYFWGDTWSETKSQTLSDEIALNPDTFKSWSLAEVLSTLVHEMCHLQQHHHGKPSRSGYHNKEWAGMMEAVGLIPTDTGAPGGKKTGQKMTHVIETGGRFDESCKKLIAAGFDIPWQALTRDEEGAAKKRASKTKYTCEQCGTNAWAKPDTHLICGECEQDMEADDE